ncbi:MAG TPA: hypothetical protein VLG50_04255 [Candidatus Saccharimonadales bacterium]|nr:hypothetical protein [Candidatus Saccharimonadales bacterium]
MNKSIFLWSIFLITQNNNAFWCCCVDDVALKQTVIWVKPKPLDPKVLLKYIKKNEPLSQTIVIVFKKKNKLLSKTIYIIF